MKMRNLLALVISSALLAVGVSALELDTSETAANETQNSAEIEAAYTAGEIHPVYGELIYFNDFESYSSRIGEDVSETSSGSGLTARITKSGDASYSLKAVSAGDNNTALAIEHTGGSWPQILNFFEADSKYGKGEYTVVYDVYVPEGKKASNITSWFPDVNGRYVLSAPQNGEWATHVKSVILTSCITKHGVYLNGANDYANDCFYIDNYRIYYNKYRNQTIPGLNQLTGTTGAVDFEDGLTYGFSMSQGKFIGVVDNSVDTLGIGNTTKVLKGNGNNYQYLGLHIPTVFEANRKYEIKYDVFFSKINGNNIAWMYDVLKYDSAMNWEDVPALQKNAGADKWYSFTKSFTTKDTNKSRGHIFIQQKLGPDGGDFDVDVCYDNISLTPYYKIDYMNADGTTVKVTDWVLRDGSGNIVTSYIPSSDVHPFWNGETNKVVVGWSTECVNGKIADRVILENKDIVLYPVYEDSDKYIVNDVMSAAEGNWRNIFFTKEVDSAKTTIDFGTTGASASFNKSENAYAVVPGGYSGEVTFNLTFTDGTTSVEKLYLYSGNHWKPGLNIFTGTTEAMDFEHVKADNLRFVLESGSFVWAEESGNGFVYATENFQYTFSASNFDVIELNRKVSYKIDVNSDNGAYLCVNGSSGGANVAADIGATNGWETRTWDFSFAAGVGNVTEAVKANGLYKIGYGGKAGSYGLKGTDGKKYLYADNISIIPYYMITYVDVDGTETVDQVLYDESGNVLEKYTPKSAMFGSGAAYYSLSADGSNPISFADAKEIALENKDFKIYAVADLTTEKSVGFKFVSSSGTSGGAIRFKSAISFAHKAIANEYGFLATRQVLLDAMSEKTAKTVELTFDFKNGDKPLYVSEKAYEKGTDLDKMTAQTDNGAVFAAAVIGINAADAEQVNEKIVVRPYVKFVKGETTYTFYGEKYSSSLVEAAEKADINSLTEEEKAKVEAIIALKK